MPYKHDYAKALERLSAILLRLYEGQALSVPELAVEFGVTERTLQRDFNERLSHLPIERTGRHWRLKKGALKNGALTTDDRITLELLRSLSLEAGKQFGRKAAALLDRLSENAAAPIYARLNMEDISGRLSDIALIENAIADRAVLTGRYEKNGEIEAATIRPLKLACFEGFWYLLALEEDGVDVRKYHFKSLGQIARTNRVFKWPDHLQNSLDNALSVWFQPLNDPFEVLLWVSEHAAKYFERKPLQTQRIVRRLSDGSLELSLTVTHEMEVIPVVKYWMPHLRVIEPAWIAEIIQADAKAWLNASD